LTSIKGERPEYEVIFQVHLPSWEGPHPENDMENPILKATLMRKFSDTKKYQWRLVNMENYVYWTGPGVSFVPGDEGRSGDYVPGPGVSAAENHLRKMNGLKPLGKPLGYSLFFFMDGRDYGLPMRLLEAHMLVKYGTQRYVARWERFYDDAVRLIAGSPEVILRLREKNHPNSTIPHLNDDLY
jgi:hypothetical protein